MHFTTFILAASVAIPAVFVGAQSSAASSAAPTSTSGIDACVLTCVTQASSSAGCSGITDLQCLCTSTTFQSAAAACLQANCTSADIAAGEALQQQECATVSGATTIASATGSVSSVASSGASSVSSAASSAVSSISSIIGSATSSAGSIISSATNAVSSASAATGAASSSSAAGSKASFDSGIFVSAAVGILGIAAGAILV